MALHLIKSTFLNRSALSGPLRYVRSGDSLLLIENAVLELAFPQPLIGFAEQVEVQVFALQPDCVARGIKVMAPEITLVDYEGFVVLTENTSHCVNWT